MVVGVGVVLVVVVVMGTARDAMPPNPHITPLPCTLAFLLPADTQKHERVSASGVRRWAEPS